MLYELVVIKHKEEPKVLKTNMTKKEAEAELESWKLIYNSDVFFDPVPKLKIRPATQES